MGFSGSGSAFSWTVNAMVLHAVENLLAVRRLQNEIQTLYELRQENRDIHRLGCSMSRREADMAGLHEPSGQGL